jgi:hypothetical protein
MRETCSALKSRGRTATAVVQPIVLGSRMTCPRSCVLVTCLLLWMQISCSTATPIEHQHPSITLLGATLPKASSSFASTSDNPFQVFSEEWLEQERMDKRRRMQERADRTRAVLHQLPPPHSVQELTPQQLDEVQRNLKNWFGSSITSSYSEGVVVDPAQTYDKWAQAYRMLGGLIDCDHTKQQKGQKGGQNNNNNNNNNNNSNKGCSRWMLWAAVSL